MPRWNRALWILAMVALMFYIPPSVIAAESDPAEDVLGQNSTRLIACDAMGHRSLETSFGDVITDAMAACTDAEIALLPCGELGNHLQAGPVRRTDLQNCLRDDPALGVTEVTSSELWDIMENSVSHLTLREDQTIDWAQTEFDGFLLVSGLHVVYDAAAPAGDRILLLERANGEALTRETSGTFMIVSTETMLSGAYGYPKQSGVRPADHAIDALAAYIRQRQTIYAPQDTPRIEILGVRTLFAGANARVVGLLVAIVGISIVLLTRKRIGEITTKKRK